MWHADNAAEQLLKEIGIPFDFKRGIAIKRLKLKESLNNNARLSDPLDAEFVEKYAYDMKRGVSFPAPVITRDGVILAGNQRTHAALQAGRTAIDAYVIGACSQKQIDDFIRRDNTRHGKAVTTEEKIEMCVFQHRQHGTPLRELCNNYFGDNNNMYGRIVNANAAKSVEDKLGERHITAKLPQSSLVALHPIRDTKVLCDTYNLASDFNLNTQQIDELAGEICKKGSEKERQAVIVAKKTELKTRVKTGIVTRQDVRLKKQLTSFGKFLKTGHQGKPFPPIKKLTSDQNAQREMKVMIDELIANLKRLKEKAR